MDVVETQKVLTVVSSNKAIKDYRANVEKVNAVEYLVDGKSVGIIALPEYCAHKKGEACVAELVGESGQTYSVSSGIALDGKEKSNIKSNSIYVTANSPESKLLGTITFKLPQIPSRTLR